MAKVILSVAVAAWRTLTAETVTVAELEANPVTKGLSLEAAVQAHIDSVLPTVAVPVLFGAYYSTRIADLSATIGNAEGGDKILKRLAARMAKLGNTEAAVDLLAQAAEEAGIAIKGGRVASAPKSEKKAEKKAKKAREKAAPEPEPETAPKPKKDKKGKKDKGDKKAKSDKPKDPNFSARMKKLREEKAARQQAGE